MKYCSKCGRELFDRDVECDKCKSTSFISEEECQKIIQKINKSNIISQKILLKDPIYKIVYNSIINKPREYFNPCITNNYSESNEEYFNRIRQHTMNESVKQNVPKCQICGSTNVKKISGASRAASIGFWGIFSKKIGKQWHCNNCGSDF